MTKEEKQLLIKDLCARLPYGIYVQHKNCPNTKFKVIAVFDDGRIGVTENEVQLTPTSINECKPYLRPMSSMTKEEEDELYTAMDWYGEIDESGNVYTKGQEKVYRETFYEYTDWLNAHHFDYRGLIPMGLALEAPEDMYNV